jgi:AraC-like DNA-binding protein
VPIQLKLPEQQVFFGILLQPMAVRKILNTPASQFSDLVVDLTLVDADFHSLWHQLAEQTDFDSRVALFSKWVETKSCPDQPREKLVNDFLMQGDRHNISVSALASSLCYSTRQLSRKILESTGMNTEEILLYKKYLHAMHLIHHTNMSLTQIAYESNFSDQSHLIKSFKSFTQMTPGEYKRNKSVVKGHLYEHVR